MFLIAEFFALRVTFSSGADEAWLYDTLRSGGLQDKFGQILARARSFTLAGILVSAFPGGLIIKYWGLNIPMRFSSLSGFLMLLIVLFMQEPKNIISEI